MPIDPCYPVPLLPFSFLLPPPGVRAIDGVGPAAPSGPYAELARGAARPARLSDPGGHAGGIRTRPEPAAGRPATRL